MTHMGQFSTVSLADNRVLVKGTDSFGTEGETVVDGTEWAHIKGHSVFNRATEAFDAAVEAWIKPITDAAEALENAVNQKSVDPAFSVVIEEAVEGQPAQPGIVHRLSKDSVILRLIEEGNADRLVWVMGQLEVLELVQPTSAPLATPSGDVFDQH